MTNQILVKRVSNFTWKGRRVEKWRDTLFSKDPAVLITSIIKCQQKQLFIG